MQTARKNISRIGILTLAGFVVSVLISLVVYSYQLRIYRQTQLFPIAEQESNFEPRNENLDSAEASPSPFITPLNKDENDKKTSIVLTPTDTPIPTTTSALQDDQKITNTTNNSPTSVVDEKQVESDAPAPTAVSEKMTVVVSIDEAGSFELSVNQGKNHCDVLSQALSEGKISNLSMEFNPTFGSNAVYQINGLGEDGQVWWTYSINGKNPPQGCSHVQVQNNDQVNWIYVGKK